MFLYNGYYAFNKQEWSPQCNEKCLKRLQEIVDYAESLNIKVAFENTKIKGYLNYVIKNLKECNYDGPITIELCYRYEYLKMEIDEFYQKGYEIGIKLKEMFEKE